MNAAEPLDPTDQNPQPSPLTPLERELVELAARLAFERFIAAWEKANNGEEE
jgi:hypothetical protein